MHPKINRGCLGYTNKSKSYLCDLSVLNKKPYVTSVSLASMDYSPLQPFLSSLIGQMADIIHCNWNNLNNFSKHVKVQLRENSWTLLLYIYILLTFWNTSTVFYFLLDLISTLLQVETWLEIAKKLMPDGRIMVNCGGADAAVSLADDMGLSSWVQNPTIKALCAAFPGQVRLYMSHRNIHISTAIAV